MLWLAAVASPCAAFSQPSLERLANEERRLVEVITEEQARNGVYSPELIRPLTALGLLYQDEGAHDLAVPTLEQALQVMRVHYGLHSLDQVPLLRQLISSEQARGNVESASRHEVRLLDLAGRHPEDLRSVPILRDAADRLTDVLIRYATREPFQFDFDALEQWAERLGRQLPHGSLLVWTALKSYRDAADVLVRNELYSSAELRELEMRIIHFSYALVPNHSLGRESYARLVGYQALSSQPLLERVTTLVEMADWDLVFMRRKTARSERRPVHGMYEDAYRLLEQEGVARASIEALFSPEIPVVLPAFMPTALLTEETPRTVGYVDVVFELNDSGLGENVEIVGGVDVTEEIEDRVVGLIEDSRFRPRVVEGQVVRSSPVAVRYYFEPQQES